MSSESKRPNPTSNKVPIALPKADSAQVSNANLVSQDVGLQLAVGSRIRVSTAAPSQTTVEGTVYTADTTTGLLVIHVSSNPTSSIAPTTLAAPAGAYRIIPMSQISSFQILNLSQPTDSSKTPPAPGLNTLDTNALSKRLDRAVTAAQALQQRRGPPGTSAIDQDVFNALAKTHPAHWHGTSMVISEVFIIDKPYEKANVRLIKGAAGDINRMSNILDIEKQKAKLKQPLNITLPGEAKSKGG